jgi:hypothetical protein
LRLFCLTWSFPTTCTHLLRTPCFPVFLEVIPLPRLGMLLSRPTIVQWQSEPLPCLFCSLYHPCHCINCWSMFPAPKLSMVQ